MALEHFLAEQGYHSPLPDITGRYAGKNLAICGDGACVWDDLERLGCRVDGGNARRGSVGGAYDFLTINKLVEVFPGNIEHAYSNEYHLLQKFIAARRSEYAREFTGPRHIHGRMGSGAQWCWPWKGPATSALGATLIGVALGYDKIVLCGVPLDDGPHNGEPPWRMTRFSREAADSPDGINRFWRDARDKAFQGRVRSMSGRTKAWLGAP